MPEPVQPGASRSTSGPHAGAERAADHAAIDRLSDELLPALIAKLGATGLGELEVREGVWRVRLRRPADGTGAATRAGAATGRARAGGAVRRRPGRRAPAAGSDRGRAGP